MHLKLSPQLMFACSLYIARSEVRQYLLRVSHNRFLLLLESGCCTGTGMGAPCVSSSHGIALFSGILTHVRCQVLSSCFLHVNHSRQVSKKSPYPEGLLVYDLIYPVRTWAHTCTRAYTQGHTT